MRILGRSLDTGPNAIATDSVAKTSAEGIEKVGPNKGIMVKGEPCSHPHRATGVVDCDLSRSGEPRSVYTAQFSVSVCETCGHTEFYAKSHHDLCRWLSSSTREQGA
jgi:hypothetical protein